MAAVTIRSDFEVPQNSLSLFPLFPHLVAMKWMKLSAWNMLDVALSYYMY